MQKFISKTPSGRAGEYIMNKEKTSLEDQVKKISEKLKSMDKRLKKLENAGETKSKESNDRKKEKKNNNSKTRKKGEISTDHKYLKRTIKDAKKRYEKEHKL